MITSRTRLRDSWMQSTNISFLANLVSPQQFAVDVQCHLHRAEDQPLHARINNRADLWTTPYMARAFGYGKGNRTGRRLRLLWQQGKISGEQFSTAAPEIARRTYGIIS